jgi:hypothetical protein
MADQPASLDNHKPAPLDVPAGALIAALRAAPEGDVLWSKEGDAWWIARRAPMDVLLRAGDLLRIPHLDHYSQIALADEVTRAARGPYLHGGPNRVEPGGLIHQDAMPRSYGRSRHNCFTTSRKVAEDAADSRDGRGHGWIHVVQPTGPVEVDPAEPESWRSEAPLRVISVEPGSLNGPSPHPPILREADARTVPAAGDDLGAHSELPLAENGSDTACNDCGRETLSLVPGVPTEHYMVHDQLWQRAGLERGHLCIACLERRLGRQLARPDFPDVVINDPSIEPAGRYAWSYRTERLKDRWKRQAGMAAPPDSLPSPFEGAFGFADSASPPAASHSAQVEHPVDYPDPVTPRVLPSGAARPAAAGRARQPAARRTP